jgi:uncharacterized protein
MIKREWVIKASKLCNLRCQYCYEWDQLSDPTRMSAGLWERVLQAAFDHHHETARQFPADDVRTVIIWHGGEPTLLPVAYFEMVIDLQHRIFGKDCIESGRLENRMQTNLYATKPEMIDFLIDHEFELGVSLDYVPGIRVTAGGGQTEDRVQANMATLRQRGHELTPLVVLAGHTAPEIETIYRTARDDNRNFQVLPLFLGPEARPMEGAAVDADVISDALYRLFVAWYEDGAPIEIGPIDQRLKTVLMHLVGLEQPIYDRAVNGDSVLVVDIDGALYKPCDEYGLNFALGNLQLQTMAEIAASEAYARSLKRDEAQRQDVCGKCRFLGACSTYPIFATNDGYAEQGDCRVTRPLLERMEAYLRAEGIDRSAVRAMFLEEFPVLPGDRVLAAE